MKKILAITLAALMALSFVGCSKDEETATVDADGGVEKIIEATVEYEGYEFGYAVNDHGDYEITYVIYDGSDSIDIEIPDEIDGRDVTGIAKDAFKADTFISSVKIPDSITYIDDFAFYGCTGLTEITLPDSITDIGAGAFMNCDTLKTVKLSAALKNIDNYAFMNCKALEAIALPETLEAIGEGAFFACETLTAVVIPASVKTIGKGAFIYCEKLAAVTVKNANMSFPTDKDELGHDRFIGVFVACADGLVITADEGSTAKAYALAEEITFTAAAAQ